MQTADIDSIPRLGLCLLYYASKIAYNALEQCSRILPIHLVGCELSHDQEKDIMNKFSMYSYAHS